MADKKTALLIKTIMLEIVAMEIENIRKIPGNFFSIMSVEN